MIESPDPDQTPSYRDRLLAKETSAEQNRVVRGKKERNLDWTIVATAGMFVVIILVVFYY